MNMIKVCGFDGTKNYVGPFSCRLDGINFGKHLLAKYPNLICSFENDILDNPKEYTEFLAAADFLK